MSEFHRDQQQPGESETALNVAAWHLQVLLAALANLDSKIMFVTALNVAGLSGLIGVGVAADPVDWLLWTGVATSGVGVILGFARLWSAESGQFPGPAEQYPASGSRSETFTSADWEPLERMENYRAIREASYERGQDLQRRHWLLRGLMILSLMSLALTVATTISALA